MNKLNKDQDIEQLRVLLRTRRSQQEQDKDLIDRIAGSLEKFSFLPRYFDSSLNSNTAAAVISDKHRKSLAQNMTLITKLHDSQQICQSKGLCLILSGTVTLTQETTKGQFRSIRFYNPGDVFSYLDLKYSPVGCQFTIDRKECQKQLEIGCVLLEPGGIYESLESVKEYIESSIRREISILKLNYFFLQGVVDDLIGELIFSAASLQYAQKQPVFLQYEQSEYLFIVRKGNFCVLWRSEDEIKHDNQDLKDISKDTHNNQLPTPLSCKRWPLRVYEPKDFFGEEDILQNKPRRFDVVCQTAGGYLIALPRLFFIDRLYPQLRSFFEFQVSEKEHLYEERIIQVQKQQSNKQSNNLGNNHSNSILNSPTSSSSQSYQHIGLSSLLRTNRSSRQISKKYAIDKVIQIGSKYEDQEKQINLNQKIQKIKGNSYETDKHLSAEESPMGQDFSSIIPKTLLCSKHLAVNTKEQIDCSQNKQNTTNHYEQQDSPQQHDSYQKQLKLQLSFTIKSQKKSTLDEPRRFETTKNCLSQSLLKLRGHLLETPSKSFSSLEKSIQNENSQYQKFLFQAAANQTSVSPSIYLNNIQEHIPDRRYSMKANRLNPVSKRQLNRHSTFLDQAIIQKSSSESVASHATNFSGGTVNNNILQGLSASDNGSATNVLGQQNIGINGSLNNQQNESVNNNNNNSSGVLPPVTQSFSCSLIQVNQVQDSQNQDQSYSSIPEPSRFSQVYRKIQEQQQQLGARKIIKKECALLNKSRNLNALSDYSFKLGNYKIKSEILSNSYDNLKKSQSAEKPKKHKFSGDKNVSENKPKYLFATSNNSNNQQTKYYVNRGITGNEQQKIPVSLNQPFKDQLKGMILSNIKPVASSDKQSGQFATQRISLRDNLIVVPNTPETPNYAESNGQLNTINNRPQTQQAQAITQGISGKNMNITNQTDFQDSPCLEEQNPPPKNSSQSSSFNPLMKFFNQNRGIIPQPSSLNHANTMMIPFLQPSKISHLKLGGNTTSKGQLKQILNRSLGQQPIQGYDKGLQITEGGQKKNDFSNIMKEKQLQD